MARVAALVVLSVVTFALATVIALVLYGRTESGRRHVLAILLSQARQHLDGELRIGRVEGDLTRGLVLDDVELLDVEKQPCVRARRVSLAYDLLGLVRHTLRLEDAKIEGGWVRARTMRDGRLNLAALAKPSPPSEGQPLDVIVGRARADAEVRFEPPPSSTLEPIEATLALDAKLSKRGEQADVTIARFAVESAAPAHASVELSGGLHAESGVPELRHVQVLARADGAEVRRLAPKIRVRGPWQVALNANGKLGALSIELEVAPPRGRLSADALVGVERGGAVSWSGSVRAREIDPGAAWIGAPHGRVELDASGQGENARGTVELARLNADAAGAHVRAHGQAQLGPSLGGDAYVDVEARDLSRLATLGAPALSGAIDLHGHVVRAGEHTAIDLDLHGARLGVAAARIDKIDARVHTHDLAGRAILEARGIAAAELRVDELSLAASGDPSAVALELEARGRHGNAVILRAHGVPRPGEGPFAADATIDRLMVALHGQKWETARPGQVHFDGGYRAQLELTSGAQRLALDGSVRDDGAIQARAAGHALDLERLAVLLPRPRAMPKTSIDLDTRVSGTRSAPIVDVSLSGKSEKSPKLGLDRVDAHVRAHLAHDRLQGEFAVASAGQKLNARVDVPTVWDRAARPVRAEIQTENVAMEKLAPFLPPKLQSLRGRADLHARVWGSTRKPELDAALELPSWQLASLTRNQSSLHVRYAGTSLAVELKTSLATAKAKAGSVEARFTAPIDLQRSSSSKRLLERLEHQTPLEARVAVSGLDFKTLPLGQLGVRAPLAAGTLDGEVQLSGTLHDPTVRAHLEGRGLDARAIADLGVGAKLEYRDGHARLDVDGTLRGAALLHARAETDLPFRKIVDGQPWKDAPLRVDATIPSYDLARATTPPRPTAVGKPKSATPESQLAGRVDGKFEVRGTLAHPTGSGELRAAALRVGAMQFPRALVSGRFDGALATGALTVDEAPSGSLRVNAAVPLAADQPWQLALAVKQLRLRAERLGSLRKLDSKLDAEVTVAGTRAHPRVDGYARVDGGQVGVVSQSRIYQQIQLDVGIAGGDVQLKKFAVAVGTGWIRASGTARLDGFQPAQVDLSAEADRFPIATGAVGAWLDARVDVHGARQDGVLRGEATIKTATAHLPKLATGKKLQSTGPLADVVFTDEQALRERAARARAAQAGAQAELKAHIPGPFKVRSPELMTDLKGDLDVELVGTVA
ncbi:MAG TPA: translocation/assembly module TamB domain-containing protein, partial [Polyangia bacterium]|nr:translocation/assembly module TamB domain-containing protein [Polyangia bacterium]